MSKRWANQFVNSVARSYQLSKVTAQQKSLLETEKTRLRGLFKRAQVKNPGKAVLNFLSDPSDVIDFTKDYLVQRKIRNQKEIQIKVCKIQLNPLYVCDYSISETFYTTVGAIHSINETSSIGIDENADFIDDSYLSILKSALETWEDKKIKPPSNVPITSIEEKLDISSIMGLMKEYICGLYAQTVSYMGNNGVRYQKVCTPSPKNVEIKDLREIFMPYWILSATLNGFDYNLIVADFGIQLKVIADASSSCSICQSDAKENSSVCDECSRVVCKKDSLVCTICNKIR